MSNGTRLLRSSLQGWFALAGVILVAQAGAMHMLSLPERDLPLPPLDSFPAQFSGWNLQAEQQLEPAVAEYLKPDSYLLRDYVNPAEGSYVNLFVAYFKSLQNSYGPHSPRVCLPGSGWLVSSSRILNLRVPGYPQGIPVNRYTMEKNNDHILVLYWYQNNRNIWAQEFKAKLTLLPDLIRYRRSDVSLVRLVAPMKTDDPSQELASTQEFAKLIFPVLVKDFKNSN
jgi:EpsI family protein